MNDTTRGQPTDHWSEVRIIRTGVARPGRRFAIALLVLTLLELYSVSLPGRADWHLFLLMAWGVTALAWLSSLVMALVASRGKRIEDGWRFAAIAVYVLALFLVAQSDVFLRLRFELSRPAFESALAEMRADSDFESSDRWIGLYHIASTYRDEAIWFEVAGTGGGLFVVGGGFAWAEHGARIPYDRELLGGQWYAWVDRW